MTLLARLFSSTAWELSEKKRKNKRIERKEEEWENKERRKKEERRLQPSLHSVGCVSMAAVHLTSQLTASHCYLIELAVFSSSHHLSLMHWIVDLTLTRFPDPAIARVQSSADEDDLSTLPRTRWREAMPFLLFECNANVPISSRRIEQGVECIHWRYDWIV